MFVPMEFSGLTHDQNGSPIALLNEINGVREIRIAVSANDAARIAIFSFPGINEHARDFSQELIEGLEADVTHMRLIPKANLIVQCQLFIEQNERIVQLEPRPGEAIVLALLNESPISADPRLFEIGPVPTTLRDTIRMNDVDDFGTFRMF